MQGNSSSQSRKLGRVSMGSGVGARGTFYAVMHDPAKVDLAPGKAADAEDFWKFENGEIVLGEDGFPVPTDYSHITNVVQVRNKFLRRGLSNILFRALQGHPGGTYYPPEMTSEQYRNPFKALFVAADAPGKPADARVDWNESDGVSDNNMGVNTGVAGQGRRALLNTGTTGPGLKKVSHTLPTSSPYREIEFVYFAQANVPDYATGQVVVQSGATMADGATIELDDGIHPALTFEFDSNASVAEWDGDTSNNIPIVFAGGDTQAQVRDATVDKINEILEIVDLVNGNVLLITAAAGSGGDVDLTHDGGGEIGNTTITVSGAGLAKTDFTGGGGGATELLDDAGAGAGVDNLQIKTLGMSYGILCGSGEADSQIGIRAVSGLPAQIQGFSDRIYQHEGTGANPSLRANSLHKYVTGETLGGVGSDGYVVNDSIDTSSTTEETAVTDRTIAVNAADLITAADDSVYLKNGDMTKADEGRTMTFVGNANNPGDFYIQQVITHKRAIIIPGRGASAISSNDSGAWTSTTIQDLHYGSHAFDGDVLNEGVNGVMEPGQSYRSNNAVGPHIIGRIWQNPLDITGLRIIGAAGVPKDNYPDLFTLQYLDVDKATASTLEPYNDNHWTTIDSPVTDQAGSIFDGAEHGHEILFTTPPPAGKCYGIRLKDTQGFDVNVAIEVAELLCFTTRGVISLAGGTNDILSVATDAVPTGPDTPNASPGTYRNFEVGTLATTGVASNEDMQQVVDEINRAHLENAPTNIIMRGFELEASRSELGFLWIRTTVAGFQVQLDLDSDDNTGNKSCNAELGFQTSDSTVTQKVGVTQPFMKLPEQAMTIIYRANISGDLPVPTL